MVSPPAWPERPGNAQDFDLFWLVRDLPPEPFPLETYAYELDRPHFGPPGTHWVYSVEQLIARETAPGVPQAVRAAAARLISGAGGKLPGAGSAGWIVPGVVPPPEPDEGVYVPQSWIRTQITATIGTDEEVVHTLQWKHSTQENAPIDIATVKAVGDAVRNAWTNYFPQVRLNFPAELRYREVRSAALFQNAPGEKPGWPLPTQVSPFQDLNMNGGGSQGSLPYEVALALSLNTNWRGTSRFRGRLYLGPLGIQCMGPVGQFDGAKVEPMGALFGSDVLAAVEASTDYEAHVISQKYGTSAKITGVRVGHVPDSQRRRRRDRPEAYYQAWGNPVGFFPPGA